MDEIVGESFRLLRKIGQGSFGRIYVAEHIVTKKLYAVKLEDSDSRFPQLLFESRIYTIMSGCTNVPRLHHHCVDLNYNIMVVDLLGKSIEGMLDLVHRRMSLKTVLMLAEQMISSVEFFHKKNYIHRDLKPDNFVMGTGKNANKLFIIDYGLAKKYRDQNTLQHIQYSDGKSLTGTARYASINALRGVEQTRRDDMEALGYVFVYLLKGSLPWMGVAGRDRNQKYQQILECKKRIKVEELCEGLPNEFAVYLRSVKNLEFAEEPNYAEYRKMFRNLFMKKKFVFDYEYDWTAVIKAEEIIQHKEVKNVDYELSPVRAVVPKKRKKTKLVIEEGMNSNEVNASNEMRSEEFMRTADFEVEEKDLMAVPDKDEEIDDFVPKRRIKMKKKLPLPPPGIVVSKPNHFHFPSLTEEVAKTKDVAPVKKKKSKAKKSTKRVKKEVEEIKDKPVLTMEPKIKPSPRPILTLDSPRKSPRPKTIDPELKRVQTPLLNAIMMKPKSSDTDDQDENDSAGALRFTFLKKEAEKMAEKEVDIIEETKTIEKKHHHHHHHQHTIDKEPLSPKRSKERRPEKRRRK